MTKQNLIFGRLDSNNANVGLVHVVRERCDGWTFFGHFGKQQTRKTRLFEPQTGRLIRRVSSIRRAKLTAHAMT